jgi:hypothetical protein
MKAAIFQGMFCHYEMLGYAIEFCITHGIDFDIYSNYGSWYRGVDAFIKHSQSWYDFYTMKFGSLPWIPSLAYGNRAGIYDVTFLLTDTDFDFSHDWASPRVICIDHYFVHNIENIGLHIGVRPFPANPTQVWAIPCYSIVPTPGHKYGHLNPDRVHVGFLGAPNVPSSCDVIRRTFANADDIVFHVIARQVDVDYSALSNVHVYQDIGAYDMINVLAQCHYMFCYDYHPDYQTKKTSGAIPMAFNVGARLILPKTWADHYPFTSALVYEEPLQIILTVQDAFDNVENVFAERDRLINMRNSVFKDAINRIGRTHA